MSLRLRLHRQLDPAARERPGLSPLNKILVAFLLAAVTLGVLETEPTLVQGREALFGGATRVFLVVFGLEYMARLWAVAETAPATPWRARLRWIVSPTALIDLVALASMVVTAGAPAFVLRLARVLRIARLAHFGRFSRAAAVLAEALSARRAELLLTLMAGGLALIVAASLLYVVEGEVQPDKFGSIPRAMWWAVVTLTTIGYGDTYPVTTLGKILAGTTAVVGIALIAAPTGILASAVSDAAQRSGGDLKP